jgi:hypothetical protein
MMLAVIERGSIARRISQKGLSEVDLVNGRLGRQCCGQSLGTRNGRKLMLLVAAV